MQTEFRAFAAEHYVPFAAVQMGMVRLTSDLIAQSTHAAVLSPAHAAAMAATGLTCSGAGGALWLRYLENQLGPNEEGSHRLVLSEGLLGSWVVNLYNNEASMDGVGLPP